MFWQQPLGQLVGEQPVETQVLLVQVVCVPHTVQLRPPAPHALTLVPVSQRPLRQHPAQFDGVQLTVHALLAQIESLPQLLQVAPFAPQAFCIRPVWHTPF